MRSLILLVLTLSCALVHTGCVSSNEPIVIEGVTLRRQPPKDLKLIEFTTPLRNQYGLANEDLKNLQFFVAEDIKLTRLVTGEQRAIAGGILVYKGQQLYEEILIEQYTPGVAYLGERNHVVINFTKRFPNCTLTFGDDGNAQNGRYELWAKWKDGNGLVTYGDSQFTAVEESWRAYLLVAEKGLTSKGNEGRTEEGHTLPGFQP